MGAIPSVPHNEQIRRFGDDAEYVRELFEANKDRLGQFARRKLEGKLGQHNDAAGDYLVKYLASRHSTQDDTLRGRCEFDLDKAANMIAFFAGKIRDVAKTKLLKLLWYADFVAYERTLRSISGMVYCHNHYGPTPMAHEVLLSHMQSEGLIDLKPDASGMGDAVDAVAPFDDSMFTEEELRVLGDVCDRFASLTANRVSRLSHLEDAYKYTQVKGIIPYDYAMSLKAIQ
jgi:hypothetical protein